MTTTVTLTPMHAVMKGHNVYGTIVYGPSGEFYGINPPDPPILQENPNLTYIYKSVTGVSTPNWALPKPRYVSIPRKRKPFRLKKPVPPVYRPPKRPPVPIRRAGSSDRSYERIMRKHGARLAVWQANAFKYEGAYWQTFTKYEARLARYNEFLRLYNQSTLGLSKKRAVGKITYSVNNPYSYVKIIDSNWDMNVRYRQYAQLIPPYYITFPGNASFVYKEQAYYGVSDTFFGFSDHGGPNFSFSLPASELVNVAGHKATNQLYEKLADEQVHIGNMIAERAQTYEMLTSSVARLRSFLQSPRRTVVNFITSGYKNISKQVSDDFIQYCFGVEPLVSDVYTLANKLAESMSDLKKSDMVKVRSGGSADDSFEYTSEGAFWVDHHSVKVEVRCRFMCEYRIDGVFLASLKNYGLVNPASVLWEVMPWSFVIDWFLPIGKFISSISAENGLEFSTGTRSTLIRTTKTVVRKYRYYDDLYVNYGKEWVGEISRTQVTETKHREVLTAPPVSRLPRFKSPFSTRHFLLSLALWRQRI
jgi:hypothetical protein